MAQPFFDTNILLYLVGSDPAKADRAEALLAGGGVISVQVLNEFASVASRKQRMPWPEIEDVLRSFRALCRVEPLTVESHDKALQLARDHAFSFYDAMIIASALGAQCDMLYTEDLQHGRRIDRTLAIRNPFRP
jgi:predicted nucleic acid-binding protein